MRLGRWALVFGLGCLVNFAVSTGSHAQERTDQEARALFMAGQVAFEEGRFESAVQYFLQSYQLSRRAELLYNIGNTYDRLQQQEEALRHFEQYLRERPDAENYKQVEARARLLRQSVEARRAAPAAAPSTSVPATTAPTTTAAPSSAPTPAETARAGQVEPTQSAPAAATASSQGGSGWVLWAGVGAAVAAAAVITLVVVSSGGDEGTQDPLVPAGARTVEL